MPTYADLRLSTYTNLRCYTYACLRLFNGYKADCLKSRWRIAIRYQSHTHDIQIIFQINDRYFLTLLKLSAQTWKL